MAGERRHAREAGQNQALMREVNERIERLRDDAANPEFLCECCNPDCIETLQLSIAEYESIRSSATRFTLRADHEDPLVDLVVDRRNGYVVVEKVGEAADLVREQDPRSRA